MSVRATAPPSRPGCRRRRAERVGTSRNTFKEYDMAVNLQKGQKISLEKEAGGALSRVTMGLGWDVAKSKGFFGFGGGKGEAVDLDASCVMFDESNRPVDVVWFRQLKSRDGS